MFLLQDSSLPVQVAVFGRDRRNVEHRGTLATGTPLTQDVGVGWMEALPWFYDEQPAEGALPNGISCVYGMLSGRLCECVCEGEMCVCACLSCVFSVCDYVFTVNTVSRVNWEEN